MKLNVMLSISKEKKKMLYSKVCYSILEESIKYI